MSSLSNIAKYSCQSSALPIEPRNLPIWGVICSNIEVLLGFNNSTLTNLGFYHLCGLVHAVLSAFWFTITARLFTIFGSKLSFCFINFDWWVVTLIPVPYSGWVRQKRIGNTSDWYEIRLLTDCRRTGWAMLCTPRMLAMCMRAHQWGFVRDVSYPSMFRACGIYMSMYGYGTLTDPR